MDAHAAQIRTMMASGALGLLMLVAGLVIGYGVNRDPTKYLPDVPGLPAIPTPPVLPPGVPADLPSLPALPR